MPAAPGFSPPLKALCVARRGWRKLSKALIDARDVALVTGQPAEFRFFSSEVRSGDAPGQIIPDAERELLEISLLEVALPAVEDIPPGQPVPVQINSVITEARFASALDEAHQIRSPLEGRIPRQDGIARQGPASR